MKRVWKKAAALLMTMAMALAMILPAQAATMDTLAVDGDGIVTTAETVTISKIPATAEDLDFDTYQVLYATYDATKNAFEYHLTPWALDALVTTGGYYASEPLAIAAITAITTDGTTATEQTDIVNILAAYIATHTGTDKWTTTLWSYTPGEDTASSSLPVGAYLVIPNAENMAFLNMLVSVDAVAADSDNKWETSAHGAVLKGNEIGIAKVVKETAITDEVADESTDVQIGGTVTYTVTADVPCFANNATDIKFQIVDVPSNVKIDMDTLNVVGVNGTTETPLYTTTNYTATYISGVLTISFSDQYLSTFWDGSTYPYTSVKITYDAELLSTAAVNSENENKVTLTYGDANHTDNSANATADVYTYKAVLTKKDTDGDILSNAVFQLTDANNNVIEFVKNGTTYRVADSDDVDKTSELTTGADGTLTIIGLDADKEYTLEETKAPSGYSLNSDVLVFKIVAPTTLDGTIAGVDSKEYTDNNKGTKATNTSWTADATSDTTKLQLSLTDTEIPALPATGSIGIIVFTIAGVAIMILALVLINSGKSKQKKA